jgi:hypothetical protein
LALDVFHAYRDAFYRVRDQLAALRDRMGDLTASRVIAYVSVGIMAAILANDLIAPTPAASSVNPAPVIRSPWIEATRGQGAFALEFPALEGLQVRYVVRRHRDGGGRKDEMSWGGAADPGAYARVALYRPGREAAELSDPLDAVAAVAAESAINAELTETESKLTTKFGALALIDMTVKGGEGERACIAVAGSWSDPYLGLVAWWCNTGPELVARGQLACLLDRLALMSAGGYERLAEFFATAELKRSFCGVQHTLVNPTPKRVDDWISGKAETKLRGRIAGR